MEKTIYYSVQNGGDGSAYPRFMESKELAEWDQDHMSEGWGESCTGSITLEFDSPIFCKDKVLTKEEFLWDYYINGYNPNMEEAKEFFEKFFGDQKISVSVIDSDKETNSKDYYYARIIINNSSFDQFCKKSQTLEQIEDEIINFIAELR